MPVGIPPPEAICAACMKRKKCVTTREIAVLDKVQCAVTYEERTYDNFKYSDQHNGFICRRCWGLLGAGLKTFERVPLKG